MAGVKKRLDRQDAIRQIVRNERVRTQRDLADKLSELGYPCTQATMSRDITEMGLKKLPPEGHYVLSEDLYLQRMIHDLVTDVRRANNLVVIHSTNGAAQTVAAALDAASLPDLLGSVAGDDTILVVAASDEDAEQFVQMVESLRG